MAFYLWIAVSIQLPITIIYTAYYPLAVTFEFTYFASPSTYGVLASERFSTLNWWVVSLASLAILPIYWNGLMQCYWRTRWLRIAFLVLVAVQTAWWVSVAGIQISWAAQRNDPSQPGNPADSYRACCTPEWYNTVPTCPNYGNLSPECNPSIDFQELGSSGDFIFAFVFNFAYIVIWVVYTVLAAYFYRLMDQFRAMGYRDKDEDDVEEEVPLKYQPPQPRQNVVVIPAPPPGGTVTVMPSPGSGGGGGAPAVTTTTVTPVVLPPPPPRDSEDTEEAAGGGGAQSRIGGQLTSMPALKVRHPVLPHNNK